MALSTLPSSEIPKKQVIVEPQKVTQEATIIKLRQPQKVSQEATIMEPRQPQRVNQEVKIDFSVSEKQKLLGDEREKIDEDEALFLLPKN